MASPSPLASGETHFPGWWVGVRISCLLLLADPVSLLWQGLKVYQVKRGGFPRAHSPCAATEVVGGGMASGRPSDFVLCAQDLQSIFSVPRSGKARLNDLGKIFGAEGRAVTCCVDSPILWVINSRMPPGTQMSGNYMVLIQKHVQGIPDPRAACWRRPGII